MDFIKKQLLTKKEKINKELRFKNIEELKRDELLQIFKSISIQIGHIYGSQKQSFLKIVNGKDRTTHILEEDYKNIGILTYKSELQQEYRGEINNYIEKNDINIKTIENGYIEIKSLFLYEKTSMGKGYAYLLIDKLIKEISNTKLQGGDGILVTVSKERADASLNMFKKLGFLELREEKDKYIKGESEIILFYPFIN